MKIRATICDYFKKDFVVDHSKTLYTDLAINNIKILKTLEKVSQKTRTSMNIGSAIKWTHPFARNTVSSHADSDIQNKNRDDQVIHLLIAELNNTKRLNYDLYNKENHTSVLINLPDEHSILPMLSADLLLRKNLSRRLISEEEYERVRNDSRISAIIEKFDSAFDNVEEYEECPTDVVDKLKDNPFLHFIGFYSQDKFYLYKEVSQLLYHALVFVDDKTKYNQWVEFVLQSISDYISNEDNKQIIEYNGHDGNPVRTLCIGVR